jgi:exonuclease III
MKLISLNVEKNLHNETILAFLKKENPDVVCVQELFTEDFDLFKKELGFDGIYKLFGYLNSKSYPTLTGNGEGIAIFSKNIINSGSILYFGKEEDILKPSDERFLNEEFKKIYSLIWIEIQDTNGIPYKFITTHLPVTKEGESSPFQLEVTKAMLSKLNLLGEFVLCGDMNAPRGRKTFSLLEEKYKDNIPLEYKTSIDKNLHRVKGGIPYMVDGLFTTPEYVASNVKLVDGLSDHMAIVAEITKK